MDLSDRRPRVGGRRIALGSTAMSHPVDSRQEFHAVWSFESLDQSCGLNCYVPARPSQYLRYFIVTLTF